MQEKQGIQSCFCDCASEGNCASTAIGFVMGLTLGLGAGIMVGVSAMPSKSRMRKMAKHTTHTVQEAMDNLRDSLAQYL